MPRDGRLGRPQDAGGSTDSDRWPESATDLPPDEVRETFHLVEDAVRGSGQVERDDTDPLPDVDDGVNPGVTLARGVDERRAWQTGRDRVGGRLVDVGIG